MRVALATLVLAAACGGGSSPLLDSGGDGDDAPRANHDAPHGGSGSGDGGGSGSQSGVYSHTIAIDGANDFAPGEEFQTTTSGYTADVAWDVNNVYIGATGSAAGNGDANQWLFMYVDVDPGAGTGETTSQEYMTQDVVFPTGFGAEYYLRIKLDYSFATIEHYDGTTWSTQNASPTYAHDGDYVEAAFPRSLLTGETAGVITYLIDEQPLAETTFGGLYPDEFVDGYSSGSNDPSFPTFHLAHYLQVDFTSTTSPNDPSHRQPSNTGSDSSD